MGLSGLLASYGGTALASHLPASILSKINERNKPEPGILCFCRCRYWLFFRASWNRGRGNWGSNHANFLHFDMLKAVGTSAAVIIFTSFGGSLGYIINGWGQPGLPSYSLGYINLLNWILLSVPGFLAARKGSEIAHLVNLEHLKHLFVLLMAYTGLKMIGII